MYYKWRPYNIWFLKYNTQQTKVFDIMGHFLSFHSPDDLENQNFEKLKKLPGDIIILHMCNINDNHMMYVSWDMEHNRQNFLSFWTVFCPFTPYGQRKSKFWKHETNVWRYHHFTHVYHKWQSYDEWFIVRRGVQSLAWKKHSPT